MLPGEVSLNVLDLFSGIGGFSLGLERAGMRTVGFCEIDPYCRAVLRKHWPDVPIFEDVRGLSRDAVTESVDLVSGGFPCQPWSVAGQRRGVEDERDLWPEMLRVVEVFRPAWVCGENVAGLGSMAFRRDPVVVESRTGGSHANGVDYESVLLRQEHMQLNRICSDLDALGYQVTIFEIPACGVDAPHLRRRLWIVANASERRRGGARSGQGQQQGRAETVGAGEAVANQPRFQEREGPDSKRARTNCGAIAERGFRWIPEPDVGRVANGIPRRVDRLRALGNAVVPQIVEEIGRAIMEAERFRNG
ncbi:MAG: DNA (cytosine-5-)-methyltransferase [bacterium]|nr:DNA (cytosine-5-)-methyltransferase [bacterium]